MSAAIAQRFRFGPPRRRLISTETGKDIETVADAIDMIYKGFASADHVTDAIAAGAASATLLLETGPGHGLVATAAELTAVPAISLKSGLSDPASVARAAAALFAAGAMGDPKALFAGRSARPVDIWREHVFITSPCAPLPRQQDAADAAAGDSPVASVTHLTSVAADKAAEDAADINPAETDAAGAGQADALTPCQFAGHESGITGAEITETDRECPAPRAAANDSEADSSPADTGTTVAAAATRGRR